MPQNPQRPVHALLGGGFITKSFIWELHHNLLDGLESNQTNAGRKWNLRYTKVIAK